MVFVLDIDRGELLALDPDDTIRWHDLVAGAAPGDAHGDAASARLLASARARGWLGRDGAGDGDPGRSTPGVGGLLRTSPPLAAYACLVRSYASSGRRPFRRTYAWAQAAARLRRPPTLALDRASAAFARAECFVVSRRARADCLPRSLALFVFLCHAGVPATHRIGIDRYPFRAHAWVEQGGQPVLDSPARIARYTPIASIAGEDG